MLMVIILFLVSQKNDVQTSSSLSSEVKITQGLEEDDSRGLQETNRLVLHFVTVYVKRICGKQIRV